MPFLSLSSTSSLLPSSSADTSSSPTIVPSLVLPPGNPLPTLSSLVTTALSSVDLAYPTNTTISSADNVSSTPHSSKTAAIVLGVFLISCLMIMSSVIWLYAREKRRRQAASQAHQIRKDLIQTTISSHDDIQSSRRSIFAEIWRTEQLDGKFHEPPRIEVAELPADAAKSIYEVDGKQLEPAEPTLKTPADPQMEPQVHKSPLQSWLDLRKSGISQDTARKVPSLGNWV